MNALIYRMQIGHLVEKKNETSTFKCWKLLFFRSTILVSKIKTRTWISTYQQIMRNFLFMKIIHNGLIQRVGSF